MKLLNKEVIIAIISGFIIGLIITYGIWTANRAIQRKQQNISPQPTEAVQQTTSSPIEQNLETANTGMKLTIAQPEPNTLSNQDTIIVSGSSLPYTNIIVYSENEELVLIADQEGQFSTELNLESGINYLTITAITDNGQTDTENRTIVYSTSEI